MHLQPSNPMPDYYAVYFHALEITGCQVWCAVTIHRVSAAEQFALNRSLSIPGSFFYATRVDSYE